MQFPMQTRANEMNTTREIKNSNGFAIFITFLFGTLDVFRSGRDLAQPSRPVGKPATRKLRTNGKGRERSTQGGASGGKGGDVECDSVALHADTP